MNELPWITKEYTERYLKVYPKLTKYWYAKTYHGQYQNLTCIDIKPFCNIFYKKKLKKLQEISNSENFVAWCPKDSLKDFWSKSLQIDRKTKLKKLNENNL
jgi:hypothetical protein